jgi:energy-coupling factor transport system ATP-binding protein
VGANGAGKTTLARVLAGLIRPQRGQVIWHTNGRRPRVGLLQQNPIHQLVCDTVKAEVHFGPRNWGSEPADELERVMARTGLHGLEQRSTQALSVGQQQRTALAATLALRPALLVLDEPTIGQDRRHMRQLMELLSELHRAGQTILLITHNQQIVERYANQVWQLRDGAVTERLTTDNESGGN